MAKRSISQSSLPDFFGVLLAPGFAEAWPLPLSKDGEEAGFRFTCNLGRTTNPSTNLTGILSLLVIIHPTHK